MSAGQRALEPGRHEGSDEQQLRSVDDVMIRLVSSWQVPPVGLPISTIKSESSQPSSAEVPTVKRQCLEFEPDDVSQYGVSEVVEESFGFVWHVKNYSALAENGEILSPVFTGGSKTKSFWQLKISPKSISHGQENFGITLGLIGFGDGDDAQDRKVKGKFVIRILDADWNTGVVADQPRWVEFRKTAVWGYKKVLPAATLSDPARRLLENNSLRIQCQIRLQGDTKQKVYSGSATVRNVVDEEMEVVKDHTLAMDMGIALRNSLHTDVEIEANDGVFQAHKAILAARSPVLANFLIVDGCRDSEITKIFMHDFDAEIVQILLDHIYTGDTEEKELSKKRAVDLLQAAEKYGLDELKEDCEHAIGESITVENAADILVMGDVFQAKLLKEMAMEFIEIHKEQVYKTPSFQLISKTKPELLAEMYLRALAAAERQTTVNIEPTSGDEPMNPSSA